MKHSLLTPILTALSIVLHLPAAADPLPAYQWQQEIKISGIDDDASGITWSPVTDHLYVIIDGPERVVELSREGKALRQIKLKGFEDTEGICHIKGHTFAIIEENEMAITFIDLPPDRLTVSAKDPHTVIRIQQPLPKEDKSGLEGITYDAKRDQLFVVKEADPKVVYRISNWQGETPEIAEDEAILKATAKLDDLSDIYYSSREDLLYVISDRSKAISRIELDGTRVDHLSLKEDKLGLKKSIKDAEGVTQDKQGRLYVCSEPRNINVFDPK